MWEVKYVTPNGSIDFMWYGGSVTREEAERRFHNMSDVGLEPISIREISRMPTDREYQEMCAKANKNSDRYQVIVFSQSGCVDEKRKYAAVKKAALAARGYVNGAEPLNSGPIYDAAIVYDRKTDRVVKAYQNSPWSLENGIESNSLSLNCFNNGKLNLSCPDWKEKLEGCFRFALARQLQHQHILNSGGWLGIREADGKANDLNREIISAMKQSHGCLYLGSVNFYGEQREQICAGKASVYEEYMGQKIYNFHCSFAVPVKDDRLEEMIRDWNKAAQPVSSQSVEQIMERIDELGGEHFIWF